MPPFESLTPEDQAFYRTELQKGHEKAQRAAEKAERKRQAAAAKEAMRKKREEEARLQEARKRQEQEQYAFALAHAKKDANEPKTWFCFANGVEHGPMRESMVQEWIDDGTLTSTDYVRTDNSVTWLRLSDLPERFHLPRPSSPAPSSEPVLTAVEKPVDVQIVEEPAYADLGARLRSGTIATLQEVNRLPGRTDQLLRTIAGEGNDILLWLLRIVASVLTVGSAVGILAVIVFVVSSRFSPIERTVSQVEAQERANAIEEVRRDAARARKTPIAQQQYIKLVADEVPIRFAPSPTSPLVATGRKGDIFELSTETPDWFEIYMSSGEGRFVAKSAAQVVEYKILLPDSRTLRQEIYLALRNAEQRSKADADRKYPQLPYRAHDPRTLDAWRAQDDMNIEYQRILNDRYKLEVMHQFNVQPPIYGSLIEVPIRFAPSPTATHGAIPAYRDTSRGARPGHSAAGTDYSLEYKLAVIDAGGWVADDDLRIARFRSLLSQLAEKYVEDREQIANMTVKSQQLLQAEGIDERMLPIMEAMNQVFVGKMENQQYAEYLGIYVSLRRQGKSHQETLSGLQALLRTLGVY